MNEKSAFLLLTNIALKWYDIFTERELTEAEAEEFLEDCGVLFYSEVIGIISSMEKLKIKLKNANIEADDKEGDDDKNNK